MPVQAGTSRALDQQKMVGNKRNGTGKKLEACKDKRKVGIKEKNNRKHNL